jgi:hypothetical protein
MTGCTFAFVYPEPYTILGSIVTKVADHTLYPKMNMVQVRPDGLTIISRDMHKNLSRIFSMLIWSKLKAGAVAFLVSQCQANQFQQTHKGVLKPGKSVTRSGCTDLRHSVMPNFTSPKVR